LTTAYINRIATGVPRHDVHDVFVRYARTLCGTDDRRASLLDRMAERAGIEHRYSCLQPAPDWESAPILDTEGLYVRGRFPDTAARMRRFEAHAPELAADTVERLKLGADRDRITHLLITSCTGFSAPGLDLELIERCRLPPSVERTMIGFMGCYAAINALKLARHIVRSEPDARVLVLNLELCTLHMQETRDLAQMLCFLLFADGCAACLVTSEPQGLALDSFKAVLLPNTREMMSWHIRDFGFDMVLSGQVPAAIHDALRFGTQELLGSTPAAAIDLWAMHPGGRSILDAIERAFNLAPQALSASREVLRRYGNMSSAAVMFVLEEMMRLPERSLKGDGKGLAMSFGPGLVAETMQFRKVA
jgi:predicted naringenin-chalcone synthase